MDKAERLVEGWVRDGLLPGAVLDVSVSGRFRYRKAFGEYTDGTKQYPIRVDTVFDTASLTKVAATLPALLVLANEGKLSLEDRVIDLFPDFRDDRVTFRHLLTHSSGLPADLPSVGRQDERMILNEILAQPLQFEPGSQTLYSDLGMILLGLAIERVSETRLDRFVSKRIHEPLGMRDASFVPNAELRNRAAATECVDGAYLRGEVHDEKSFVLGGITGSAGLFAAADDLTRYAEWWKRPEEHRILPGSRMREATAFPVRGRGLAWEVKQDGEPAPSCGESWPTGSFGHTGFTGTSLWIEPRTGLSVVFLTNAVHFGRGNSIRRLRPILHDAVWSSLFPAGLNIELEN